MCQKQVKLITVANLKLSTGIALISQTQKRFESIDKELSMFFTKLSDI
jgi:hypothetical protein